MKFPAARLLTMTVAVRVSRDFLPAHLQLSGCCSKTARCLTTPDWPEAVCNRQFNVNEMSTSSNRTCRYQESSEPCCLGKSFRR